MRTATHEVAAMAWLVALATARGHSAGVSGAGTPLLLATSRLDHHMKDGTRLHQRVRHSSQQSPFEPFVSVRRLVVIFSPVSLTH